MSTSSPPNTYDFTRYLDAKDELDARSRDHYTWHFFVDSLSQTICDQKEVYVLEIGGGTGTLLQRIVGAVLADYDAEAYGPVTLRYMLVDEAAAPIRAARERLRRWMRAAFGDVHEERARDEAPAPSGPSAHDRLTTVPPADAPAAPTLTLDLVVADAFEVAAQANADGRVFDAVVGQAVLDLVNLDYALRRLAPIIRSNGLAYLPIHFDGVTTFVPEHPLDDEVERLFHASMDTREAPHGQAHGPSAGSTSGRKLLGALQRAGATIRAAGGSDWVVYAGPDGVYPGDEAYFLRHILHFVETELRGHPDLDASAFDDWLAQRRAQIDRGELVYVTHQLDVLAQMPYIPRERRH